MQIQSSSYIHHTPRTNNTIENKGKPIHLFSAKNEKFLQNIMQQKGLSKREKEDIELKFIAEAMFRLVDEEFKQHYSAHLSNQESSDLIAQTMEEVAYVTDYKSDKEFYNFMEHWYNTTQNTDKYNNTLFKDFMNSVHEVLHAHKSTKGTLDIKA